jgi:hypothetical protein
MVFTRTPDSMIIVRRGMENDGTPGVDQREPPQSLDEDVLPVCCYFTIDLL